MYNICDYILFNINNYKMRNIGHLLPDNKSWDLIFRFDENNTEVPKNDGFDIKKHVREIWNSGVSSAFVSDDWTDWIVEVTANQIDEVYRTKEDTWVLLGELWSWSWTAEEIILRKCWNKIQTILWIDIDAPSIDYSKKRIEALWSSVSTKCNFILSDMFNEVPLELLEDLDIFFLCFPQMYLPEWSVWPKDWYSHYLRKRLKQGEFDDVAYWWIFEALKKFREINKKATIISNFTWRVNPDIIKHLFGSIWDNHEIWLNRNIRHCPSTELGHLVELEKTSPERVWVMYWDIDRKETISIEEAEIRRKQWIDVFHDLLVVKWTSK